MQLGVVEALYVKVTPGICWIIHSPADTVLLIETLLTSPVKQSMSFLVFFLYHLYMRCYLLSYEEN